MSNSDDYTNPSKNAGGQRLEETIRDLQARVLNLSATVNALSSMSTFGNVLEEGFKMLDCHFGPHGTIPAQLAELRDIGPKRQPLPAAAGQTITAVLAAMERPVFSGSGSLGIPQANVPFIGQPTPGLPSVSTKSFAELMNLLRPRASGGQLPVASSDQQIVGGEIKS